ncbi:unnamed protein product, partial [Mesorhabditis spiculigera]
MIRRDGALARAAAQVRFILLMLRLRLTGTPIVRTAHNVRAHETGSRTETALLRWCDRQTRTWIVLNELSTVPTGTERVLIPHGDYADWFAGYLKSEPIAGRVISFGLIRPYKGNRVAARGPSPTSPLPAQGCVSSAAEHRRTPCRRRICGAQSSRITAALDYVEDSTLALEITAAQLVVLPYQNMHNSGALLLALYSNAPCSFRIPK